VGHLAPSAQAVLRLPRAACSRLPVVVKASGEAQGARLLLQIEKIVPVSNEREAIFRLARLGKIEGRLALQAR
jgi:hypothetical protein